MLRYQTSGADNLSNPITKKIFVGQKVSYPDIGPDTMSIVKSIPISNESKKISKTKIYIHVCVRIHAYCFIFMSMHIFMFMFLFMFMLHENGLDMDMDMNTDTRHGHGHRQGHFSHGQDHIFIVVDAS
jgi:hypothetical protein